MTRGPVWLLLVVALAGCVQAPDDPGQAEHRFGGSFTAQATQAQIEDFGRRMQAHHGEAIIMESFPAQFLVDGFGLDDCMAARNEARSLPYVASTNDCRAAVTGTSADQPTSTTS